MPDRPTLQVFLASPSDAIRERAVVRECVTVVNAESLEQGGPLLELRDFTETRGTARRPQDVLNAVLNQCDYLIVLFLEQWGSDPGGPERYSSGTEEELFVGLLGLQDAAHPLRDVSLMFVHAAEVAPEVLELKEQVRAKHAMYYEEIADEVDLRAKVSEQLRGWSKLTSKEVRKVELIPRSGRDVLRADRLRREGEMLVELGVDEQGLARLREAAQLGGITETLALARVLARRGELGGATVLCDEAIAQLSAGSGPIRAIPLAEVYAYRADLLRRTKDSQASADQLRQALSLLDGDGEIVLKLRCRILDSLGLADTSLGNHSRAREAYLEGLKHRRPGTDLRAVGQSLVNLTRNAVALKDLEAARDYSSQALDALQTLPPSPLHANALLARAQVLHRSDQSEEAIELAHRSVVLNRQFGSKVGEAMALNVLAQAYDAVGKSGLAAVAAHDCMAVNNSIGRTEIPHNIVHLLPTSATPSD